MSNIKCSLLIAKKKEQTLLPDDYKLGWLYEDDKRAYWMIWGSSKNKELALSVARETLKKQGAIDVFISETPLTKYPSKTQIDNLQKIEP